MVLNLFGKLFSGTANKSAPQKQEGKSKNFNESAYDRFNEKKIAEFCSKYDLSTVEGIMAIPISDANRYSDGGQSVVYMPEQILNKKATEYKKSNQYDLAIACLSKANELYGPSCYEYTRENYERLVYTMVEAGLYDVARKTHKELDESIGTHINTLYKLMNTTCITEDEKSDYKKRVIDNRISEEKDREIFYYLLENYHKIAPKSFGGFRRMKNMESENYKKIVSCLEKDGMKIEDIKFWINDDLY